MSWTYDSYHWCHDLTHREIKMGKIHIIALLIFVIHISLGREIDVCFDQDIIWTKVKGIEPYKLLSDALSVFIETLLNVCATILKLFIIRACLKAICIDIFIEILVIYVIQFSSGIRQMLVQELQDLFTLAGAVSVMMKWQTISGHYCRKGYSSLCKHS